MIREMAAAVALCAAMGCSVGPAETALKDSSPDAFAGSWHSVTPSLEFIRLSVNSKSSEMGVLGARLTFSGVAWEGSGRIDGDSLVAGMTMAGTQQSSGMIAARTADGQTLRVQVRPAGGAPIDLTLIRD